MPAIFPPLSETVQKNRLADLASLANNPDYIQARAILNDALEWHEVVQHPLLLAKLLGHTEIAAFLERDGWQMPEIPPFLTHENEMLVLSHPVQRAIVANDAVALQTLID